MKMVFGALALMFVSTFGSAGCDDMPVERGQQVVCVEGSDVCFILDQDGTLRVPERSDEDEDAVDSVPDVRQVHELAQALNPASGCLPPKPNPWPNEPSQAPYEP